MGRTSARYLRGSGVLRRGATAVHAAKCGAGVVPVWSRNRRHSRQRTRRMNHTDGRPRRRLRVMRATRSATTRITTTSATTTPVEMEAATIVPLILIARRRKSPGPIPGGSTASGNSARPKPPLHRRLEPLVAAHPLCDRRPGQRLGLESACLLPVRVRPGASSALHLADMPTHSRSFLGRAAATSPLGGYERALD